MEGIWTSLSFEQTIPIRCSHTATVVDNEIYVIGGGKCHADFSFWEHYGDIWKINPMTTEIIKIESISGVGIGPRRGHSAVCYQNRFIIIFGGLLITDDELHIIVELSDDLKIFDIYTSSWLEIQEAGRKPPPTRGHIAAIYENAMILFGGDSHLSHNPSFFFKLDLTPLRDFQNNLQPVTLTWRILPASTNERYYLPSLSATCVIGSLLFIYGGTKYDKETAKSIPSKHLYVFDLQNDMIYDLSFHCRFDLSPPSRDSNLITELDGRFCAAMSSIEDKYLIVYGGTTESYQYPSTILYFTIPSELISNIASFHAHEQTHEQTHEYQIQCGVLSTSTRIPSCRNGMIFVPTNLHSFHFPQIDLNSTSLSSPPSYSRPLQLSYLMFGGGKYPNEYFNDWFELNIYLPPTILLNNILNFPPEVTTMNFFESSFKQILLESTSTRVSSHFIHLLSAISNTTPNLLISLSSPSHSPLSEGNHSTHLSSCIDIPVHLEILSASCDYFKSLLSSQWNDLSEVKSYLYQPPASSSMLTTLTLPVVRICDVDFEMMIIILIEIYYHHYVSQRNSFETLSVDWYLAASFSSSSSSSSSSSAATTSNSESELESELESESKLQKLLQYIHYFNRFQLISSQLKCERYVFHLLTSSYSSSHEVANDIPLLCQLLTLSNHSFLILIPHLAHYYLNLSLKISKETVLNRLPRYGRRQEKKEEREGEREGDREKEGDDVLTRLVMIKNCLNEEPNQLSLEMRTEIFQQINELEILVQA